MIPASTKAKMVPYVANVIKCIPFSQKFMMSADEVVGAITNKTVGTYAMVGLAVVYLSLETILICKSWYNGEITGKRCSKKVIDTWISTGCSLGAGWAGAIYGGAFAGPVGAAVGGIAAGVIAASVVNYLVDRLTQWIFGVPKDVALENAYRYFKIEITASHSEINKAFHAKCRQHHPDRGGRHEDFLIVQLHMNTIRMSKGLL